MNEVINNNKDFDEIQYDKMLNQNVYNVLLPYKDSSNTVIGMISVGLSMSSAEKAVSGLIVKSIIFTCIVLFISFIFIYLIINRLMKPIKLLSRTADEVAEGNLSNQLKVSSGDEIGELSSSFNEMIGNLKTLIKGIIATTSELTNFGKELLDQVFSGMSGIEFSKSCGAQGADHWVAGAERQR
jgi:methyl-accepting chemotaxis protein